MESSQQIKESKNDEKAKAEHVHGNQNCVLL